MPRKPISSAESSPGTAATLPESAGPLYMQLAENLRRRIAAKELVPGERLPTEAELGAQFGMSRITVRQAMAMLTRKGLIERFPSRGSFVTDRGGSGSWELRSISDLVQIGKETKTEVISWRIVTPPAEMIEFFGSGDSVYRLRAVRTQGAVPLYYVENHLRRAVGERIHMDDLRIHTMVELLHNKLSVPIGHANEEIAVGHANAAMAKHLWIDPGQPVIVQRIDLFDRDGAPIQSGSGWWRSERFKRKFVLNHA